MRILFAFNGSEAEPEQISFLQSARIDQIGTLGTLQNVADVPVNCLTKSSNDGVCSIVGHDGHAGHSKNDEKAVISKNHEVARLAIPLTVVFTENSMIGKALNYPDAVESDEIGLRKDSELNEKLVQCDSCTHFDFLASPISQSCMIGAAQPYRQQPRTTFLDIVAECTQRQASLNIDTNFKAGSWNEALDYPF